MSYYSESERIAELQSYDILDSGSEIQYDDITKLASSICDVPISLITLLDENQLIFKSRHGVNTKNLSKVDSFCSYAILNPNDITEIKNPSLDDRFNKNPLILDGNPVSFYAGYPLISENGMPFGALCVLDVVPNCLNLHQKETLKILANQVVKLFELHKKEKNLKKSQEELLKKTERLEAIIEGTNVGTWEWNFQSGETFFNECWANMLGYTLEELQPTSEETWSNLVHPTDAVICDQILEECIKNQIDFYDVECRMKHKDGHWIWIHDRGKILQWSENGKPLKMFGTHTNISKRKLAEEQLGNITNNIPGAIIRYRLSPDGIHKFDNISEGIYYLMGIKAKDAILDNQIIWDRIHIDDYHKLINSIEKSAKSMSEWRSNWRAIHLDGTIRWQSGVGRPNLDTNGSIYWDVLILDITKEKNITKKLKESNAKLKEAEKIAELGYWEMNLKTKELFLSDQAYKIWEVDNAKDHNYDSYIASIHPDDLERLLDTNKKAYSDFADINVEYRICFENDRYKWIHEKGRFKNKDNSNNFYYEGTIQDVTTAKEIELNLRKRNEFIEIALDNLPVGISVNRICDGKPTFINKKFSKIYGWPIEKLTCVDGFFQLIYPDPVYRNEIKTQIISDLESRDPSQMTWNNITITTELNEKRIVNAKNIPLYDQNLMISTVVDVTEVYDYTNKVEQHNNKLRDIAWMQSHEVRSPLAKLIGLVNLFSEINTIETKESQYIIQEILNSSEELDAIVKEISEKTNTL